VHAQKRIGFQAEGESPFAESAVWAAGITAKASRRDIYRWVHEEVIDRHRQRMQHADAIMRRRKALAEHPFGTIKCRAGYRHFLVRGFAKVRGEWSLMALCYNLARVVNILGLDRFIARLAAYDPDRVMSLLAAVLAVLGCLHAEPTRRSAKIRRLLPILWYPLTHTATPAQA